MSIDLTRTIMNKLYKKIRPKLHNCTAPIKRVYRNPFDNDDRKLIVHCSHHKAGTRWFSAILKSITEHYGLSYSNSKEIFSHNNGDIFMENHSHVDLSLLPPNLRASQAIIIIFGLKNLGHTYP